MATVSVFLFSSFVNSKKQITIYLRFVGFDLIKVQLGPQLCVQSVKCVSQNGAGNARAKC